MALLFLCPDDCLDQKITCQIVKPAGLKIQKQLRAWLPDLRKLFNAQFPITNNQLAFTNLNIDY